MKAVLKQAFDEAAKLPESEQEALGQWLMRELASEQRWDTLFAASAATLTRLADETRAEHRAGRTTDLDPDHL
jgi:hypothetical protein